MRDAMHRRRVAATALLRLERDGRAGAIVQIEDGGVLFDPLSGSAWFAPLPPEVVARLRATLPRGRAEVLPRRAGSRLAAKKARPL